MPAIHVRDLDDAIIAALKARAAKNRRSLQGEAKSILEAAALQHENRRAGPPGKLRLRTVKVGGKSSFSRKEIYEDDGR
jgi:plasmid stability protein